MPQIVLTADEIAPDVLPPICMICGIPATVRQSVNFAWVPTWSYILLVFGVWPWALFYLIVRREMVVEVPLCAHHRHHWIWRKWLLPAGLLLTLVVMVSPIAVIDVNAPGPPMWSWVTASFIFIATIAAAVWLRMSGVRAKSISREAVSLTGAAPAFVKAVEAGREAFAKRDREWVERYNRPARLNT